MKIQEYTNGSSTVAAKRRRRDVEKLWTHSAFPVQRLTPECFFDVRPWESARSRLCARFRRALRLIHALRRVQFTALPQRQYQSPTHVTAAVHRFEESIAGRVYQIEVAAVAPDRWRAYIVRLPGVPTALMPFYGTTPADAAEQLFNWLTRAYARASAPAGPV
jgi:hypothetical protein